MKRLIVILSMLLSGCNNPIEQKDYQRYEYDDVTQLMISYVDVFNQFEDTYYLYYFQRDCYYCHGIKTKMINFALNSDSKVYFVEIDKDYGFTSNSKEDTIGTGDYLAAFCKKTPQLSIVNNHIITDTYLGIEEILIVIE